MNQPNKKLQNIILWGVGIVTLIITPWISYDPFNAPRLLILVSTATIVFIIIIVDFKNPFKSPAKNILIVLSIFILQMLLVMTFAPGNKWQQFFGAGGRQTGFLTYLSLTILLIGSAFISTQTFLKKFTKLTLIVGTLSVVYGLIQAIGLDPFAWTNPYSPVFGFFGNPNFQAAFVGMNSAALTSLFFGKKIKKSSKIFIILYIFAALFVIAKTNSLQGFLVFGSTLILVTLVFVYKDSKFSKYKYFATTTFFFGFITATLDILQKSPWDSFLYKPSISYRGDFWRAGISMVKEHPLSGVGLDSYRDWFYRSRDSIASSRPNPNTYIDSAHNMLIDFASNGGIPLLVVYLFLIAMTARSAYKVVKRTKEFNPYFVTVLATWFGYQVQSMISINQIGLAIWGWITSGIIIGFEIHTREVDSNEQLDDLRLSKHRNLKKLSNLKIIAGLVLGFGLGAPVFLADVDFRTAVESQNIDRISATANKWPKDVIRMNFIARLFAENNLPEKALQVAKNATRYSPETFESWRLIYEINGSTVEEKAQALSKMKELDANYQK